MTQNDYRDDDQTSCYCPECGHALSNITEAGRGYCERDGWQFADWLASTRAKRREWLTAQGYGDPGDEHVPASGNNPKEG